MAFGDKYERGGILPEVDVHDHDAYRPEGLRIGPDRHPGVRHFAPLFAFGHLSGKPRAISTYFARTAQIMVDSLPDSPELTAGLRKLLESKDCMVRAAL